MNKDSNTWKGISIIEMKNIESDNTTILKKWKIYTIGFCHSVILLLLSYAILYLLYHLNTLKAFFIILFLCTSLTTFIIIYQIFKYNILSIKLSYINIVLIIASLSIILIEASDFIEAVIKYISYLIILSIPSLINIIIKKYYNTTILEKWKIYTIGFCHSVILLLLSYAILYLLYHLNTLKAFFIILFLCTSLTTFIIIYQIFKYNILSIKLSYINIVLIIASLSIILIEASNFIEAIIKYISYLIILSIPSFINIITTQKSKSIQVLEILRGYGVISNNDIKFGVRLTNNTDFVITDADVILDYSKNLLSTKDHELQHLGNITPTSARTATYLLKPLGCIHNEQINALITYKDHTGKKQTLHMHPKEVHCVCPFLKEKPMSEGEYSRLAASSEFVQEGISFKGISVEELAKFMGETCRHMLYKIKEYDLEGKRVIYLSGESLGEKAYYLLTAVIQEYKGLTQVVLRAHSDKKYGLNGFMNEMADSIRHLVGSIQKAKEIGIIENTQVINIIDSVVQRTSFNMGESGSAQMHIKESVVQRSTIGASARKCPHCGREVEANEKFCLECGAKL